MKDKKVIGIVVILVVLLVGIIGKGINEQPEIIIKSSLEEENIKGDVKSIDYQFYVSNDSMNNGLDKDEIDMEKLDESYSTSMIKDYNINGMVTSIGGNNQDGTKEIWYKYEYNDLNQLVLEKHGQILSEYTYNSKHQLDEVKTFNLDMLWLWNSYEYDRKGNISKITYYENGNETEHYSTYKYNDKGLEIEVNEATIAENGNYFIDTKTYEYDESGNKVLEIYSSTANDKTRTREKTYDKNNNLIHETSYGKENSDILERVLEYVYDEQGNWTELKHFENNKLTQYIVRDITYR